MCREKGIFDSATIHTKNDGDMDFQVKAIRSNKGASTRLVSSI